MNNTYPVHPLSRRHKARIVRRSLDQAQKWFHLWACQFLTRGHILVPAGGTNLMVLVSYEKDGRERLDLFCVTSRVHHAQGTVSWDNIRMSHDFKRNPRPCGGYRVLDPRDEDDPTLKPGDNPKGDWVRWGLDCERTRQLHFERNYATGTAPEFPRILLAFASDELVTYTQTPAMEEAAAARANSSVATLKENGLLDAMCRAIFNESLIPPGGLLRPDRTFTNGTDYWLFDQELATTEMALRASKVFEDYSRLVGKQEWNPARDVTELTFSTDTEAFLAEAPDDASNEELISLFRQQVELSELMTDEEVLACLADTNKEVKVTEEQLVAASDDLAISLMTVALGEIRPHLLPYVTDEDLLQAARRPSAPMFVAQLPRIQVMSRDMRLPIAQALSSRSGAVTASLWGGDWLPSSTTSPRREYRQAQQKVKERGKKRGPNRSPAGRV